VTAAALERFRDEYASAFRSYLTSGGEVGLESAYELGREAVTGELSLLDLAGIHHGVLAEALRAASTPEEMERLSVAGADFFLESLSTFEMTQRGFREAQETALLQQRHAAQLRGMADASLAVSSAPSVDEMLELVTERARNVIGAHRSMTAVKADEERGEPRQAVSVSDEYAESPAHDEPSDRTSQVRATNRPMRTDGWLAAPLIDRDGRNVGVIELSHKYEGDFTENDEAVLVQLAQMTSVAIANARLYEHERGIAETLQRRLLPTRLPEVPGVRAAARYIAGGAGVEVGGDWYDVIPLSGERLGVAIGDVVGRGVGAAAIMGQLRVALRAYALETESPTIVAQRLANFVQTLDEEQMTTCVYLVLEPSTGALRFSNAGHPPPLLLRPDGTAGYLEGESSPPLGIRFDPGRAEVATTLEAGSTVLLYTDGLVEERGAPIDHGLERLREAVTEAPLDPESLCDRVLAALVDAAPGDDVALIAVQLLPFAGEPLRLTLPAEPTTLASLRRTLTAWLLQAGATEDEAYDVSLAACEAATNVVEHAYGPGKAVLELQADVQDREVMVTVQDFGSWREPRDVGRGRGLDVMRAVMDAVEVISEAEGTKVHLRRRLVGGVGHGGTRTDRD
jgi:serine phosphatase RsbU (regulator of sigma subunit)/anti-sigma regulatory factor (Ser/Thr protein kinase)